MDLKLECRYSNMDFFTYFHYLVNKLSVVTAGNEKLFGEQKLVNDTLN